MVARAQLVAEVIRPHLSQGRIVICDRFAPSSVAYQGYARGLDLRLIEGANAIATQGVHPDLIVLLDVAPEVGLPRKPKRRDRFEEEDTAFHQRVRDGYLKLAANDPERWLMVDATLPQTKVTEIVWEKVERLLSEQG